MKIQSRLSSSELQLSRNNYSYQDKEQVQNNSTEYSEMTNDIPSKSLNELQGRAQVNFTGLNPKFIMRKNQGMYSIIDSTSNTEVASAITYMEGNSVTLFDIHSKLKNQGYGTKLINQIKKDYIETGKAESINLTASWMDYLEGGFPPHKFYIKNGFVPDNENQAALLEDWINKGAKAEDFPMSCSDCAMTYKVK